MRHNSLNRPPLRIDQQYQRNLYIVEKYFQCATIPSLTMRVYLHSFSRCCFPNMQTSAKFWENLNLQQFKVIQGQVDDFGVFGTNRKRICHFLLVINSNFGPILHRFWDAATYWLKIAYFFIPLSYSAPPLSIFPLKFHCEIKHQETRVMGLLCGEGCVILTSTVFDWSTRMTDGQMDGR